MLSGQPLALAHAASLEAPLPVVAEPPPAAEDGAPHAPVRVVVLKPRSRRERRGTTRTLPVARTALNGFVPHGPVAISPRDLAHAASKKNDVLTDTPSPVPNAFDELMAEATRRTMARA